MRPVSIFFHQNIILGLFLAMLLAYGAKDLFLVVVLGGFWRNIFVHADVGYCLDPSKTAFSFFQVFF